MFGVFLTVLVFIWARIVLGKREDSKERIASINTTNQRQHHENST